MGNTWKHEEGGACECGVEGTDHEVWGGRFNE
jgi:hypothetical protein